MDQPEADSTRGCYRQLFFAHYVRGNPPLIVLECCRCGRLWHQREDKSLVPYDRDLIPLVELAKRVNGRCTSPAVPR